MVQKTPLSILIYLTGGVHWIGGVQYIRNLFRAVSALPQHEQPRFILQIGRKNRGLGFEEEFLRHENVEINSPITGRNTLKYRLWGILRRVWRRVFGSNLPGRTMLSDECSVAFPVKGPGVSSFSRNVYWVPDFQYKHFPEYFSADERKERDAMYQEMFREEGILVLSSEAAKRDFHQYFPSHSNKDVRVLRFTTTLDESEYRPDPAQTCARYGLPEKFIYLPNQMWQHKGFDTAFSAFGILKKQGMEIPIVCTGNTTDYRSQAYFQELQALITENGLDGQIHLLGVLPRCDQLQIFRRAALILQPSRFEGWSTAVEDARTLGKAIVLSDIEVHREQNPPTATYFATGDAADLAFKLKALWDSAHPGPDVESERKAREACHDRSLAYAREFLKIMNDANVFSRRDADKMASSAVTELEIAALHHLLPDALQNEYFGPHYAKMVRRVREEVHPVGKQDIRSIKTRTGLTFGVNLGDRLGCDLYYENFNEQADYELFMALVEPGDTVVDVGANIGVYSLVSALRTGRHGKVFAFEPDSRSYRLLERNALTNKISNVLRLSRYCLGDYDGTISFNEATEPCLSGVIDTSRMTVECTRNVDIRKLDSVLGEIGCEKIDMMKIDVEGAEAKVIAGSAAVLAQSNAILMIEISPKNLDNALRAELHEMLSNLESVLGYQAFRISDDKRRLIGYETVDQLFDPVVPIVGGNYFLARRAEGKVEHIRSVFSKIVPTLHLSGRFFQSKFPTRLSRRHLEVLLWAERRKSQLAQHQVARAYRRLDTMTPSR